MNTLRSFVSLLSVLLALLVSSMNMLFAFARGRPSPLSTQNDYILKLDRASATFPAGQLRRDRAFSLHLFPAAMVLSAGGVAA